ncbi:hypothetical protein [Pseudoroseomonas ludipueritiae]|uniref:Uncharacterized protein n=1 Tax=Pseudoroseomonas ludipueritiae TaxID=198093 RepID=A0ABR7R324_9PROT|nr:hypothetical protein [Pseudoroseomonas ludipueritiae]MBC9176123.1 hypothetical protein [Pseudoroseomonas ludipueritiae]
MSDKIYGSLNALVPVRRLLDEAGKAQADPNRTLLSSGVAEVLGAAAGIGVGAAAGAGIVSVGAASGAAGGAALTSGLAAAGSIVGGGMMAGIAVVAAPAVVLGVGGYAAVSIFNRQRLDRERRALLQEALRKHHALQEELRRQNATNRSRAEYLHTLVVKLEDVIQNLKGDLGEKAA